MDRLILADIQALAASVDYGGSGLITAASAALGLSAALFLSNLDLWQGAGYKLTSGEIDDIQAMIAQLENDLMLAGEMYPQYRCRVTIADHFMTTDDTFHNITWTEEIFDPAGMHSLVSQTHRITVLKDGLYLVNVRIGWGYHSVGYRQTYLGVYRYGGSLEYIADNIQQNPVNSSPLYQYTNVLDEASEGDQYIVTVYQNSGSDWVIPKTVRAPFFTVVKM